MYGKVEEATGQEVSKPLMICKSSVRGIAVLGLCSWLHKFPETIVFQGWGHGLPLLFQTGWQWFDDPGVIPWDQPETASSSWGHPIEEHNAQGKHKHLDLCKLGIAIQIAVIYFQENINTLGNEISKMNRWWRYPTSPYLFNWYFDHSKLIKPCNQACLWFTDKSYCYFQ